MVTAVEEVRDILIISYVFPPYPGIGGRRWAKFAKYLAKKNIRVHVICAQNPFGSVSIYKNDIKDQRILTYPLDPKYPSILLTTPKGIFEKIAYRYQRKRLLSMARGSIYDKALFWKEQLEKKASEIIEKNNVKIVIASGAPFRINYYACQLKKKFPNLKVVNDLRDPWTWGVSYGFKDMDLVRKQFEEWMQTETMKESDVITVPVAAMCEHLKQIYPYYSSKFQLLPHGYDAEEFDLSAISQENKILYYGTLYPNQKDRFNALAIALAFTGKLKLDIFSDTTRYRSSFNSFGSGQQVTYYSPVEPRELFNHLRSSKAVLIVQPDNAKDYITTKIYEIMYAQRPIIYIGKQGDLWSFIKENGLGVCYEPSETIGNFLSEAMKKIDQLKITYDVSKYDFKKLTDQVLQIISA
jgi:glycosyltransferase involved in cell wall biosynthesis